MNRFAMITFAALMLMPHPVQAQSAAASYPSKPVRLVVPFPAGGVSDALARGVARELGKAWSQPVIVENRPGANTIIAAEAVAKSAADGHTLLLATDATLSINPALYRTLPYDPVRDFAPVTLLAQTVEVLVATPALPAASVGELVALAKRAPGTLHYASFGPGSTPHLSTEAFKVLAGIDLVHVPFKGVAEIMPALMSNQVQVALASTATPLPLIRAGKLKALAIVSKSRSPLLPEVPTLAESGYPEFDSKAWFGIVAPSGTPADVLAKIAKALEETIADASFRAGQLDAVGLQPLGGSPQSFADFLRADREQYARKVRIANVRLD